MISADVIKGLLTAIVYDGLKRPIKSVGDKLSRNREIQRVLIQRQREPISETAQVAISDLVRVIGNQNGVYGTEIASFLREIERSAIPDALKQLTLCGKNPNKVFEAFEKIYNSYPPLPFDCKTMFDALSTAISTHLKQSIGDPLVLEALHAQTREVEASIEAIADCLRSFGKESSLSSEKFNNIRAKVAKAIEADNRSVNVETTQGAKQVAINKLVLPARLVPISGKEDVPHPHRDAEAKLSQTTTFLTFRRTFKNAVILGDPGGGKTTLTQLLCYELSRQVTIGTATPDDRKLDARDFQLPLRVILRTLEKRQSASPSYNIFDFLVDEIKVSCNNDAETAKLFLTQILHLGLAVIIFDGLDEILEVGARRDMVKAIEKFSSTYASCSTLITSRIVGYRDAPMSDGHQLYTLSRFNEAEVINFSQKLLASVAQIPLTEAKEKSKDFLAQTQSAASDLRANPLLLGLMVYIFNARGDVPNNRPEIYKECSLLMFEKWDQRRDIRFKFPQDFDLLDLFGFLASEIFGDAETEDGVTEAWLSEKMRGFFTMWYNDRAKSVAASKILVSFITGRAWVMCEIGPGMFKFTHRTFLEYFFARRLEEEAGGVTSLVEKKLKRKIQNAEWDVVSHLALQIATFRSGPKSMQALDALLKSSQSGNISAPKRINYLTFVAQATEYLTLPEYKLNDAIDAIFDQLVHLPHELNSDATETLHVLISANRLRRAFVEDRLVELANALTEEEASPQRTMLFRMLENRYSGFRISINNNSRTLSTDVWKTFSRTRDYCKTDLRKRAAVDFEAAEHYVQIFRSDLVELYEIHGFDLIFNRLDAPRSFSQISLGFLLLLDAISVFEKPANKAWNHLGLNEETCVELLEMVTSDLHDKWSEGVLADFLSEFVQFDELHFMTESLALLNRTSGPSRTTRKHLEIKGRCLFASIIFLIHAGRTDIPKTGRISGNPKLREEITLVLLSAVRSFQELKKPISINTWLLEAEQELTKSVN